LFVCFCFLFKVREAAQAILLAELRRIGFDCRKKLVETWAPQLPKKLDDTSSSGGGETVQDGGQLPPPSPQLYGMKDQGTNK